MTALPVFKVFKVRRRTNQAAADLAAVDVVRLRLPSPAAGRQQRRQLRSTPRCWRAGREGDGDGHRLQEGTACRCSGEGGLDSFLPSRRPGRRCACAAAAWETSHHDDSATRLPATRYPAARCCPARVCGSPDEELQSAEGWQRATGARKKVNRNHAAVLASRRSRQTTFLGCLLIISSSRRPPCSVRGFIVLHGSIYRSHCRT